MAIPKSDKRVSTRQFRLLKENGPAYGVPFREEDTSDSLDEELPEEITDLPSSVREAWAVDQMAKSQFFHQKLHEWGMLEVADQLDQVRGEDLAWDAQQLAISEKAWARVIHRGIKPVLVFAHPQILTTIPRVVGYYRMLALVSQKSMLRIGLGVASYEDGSSCPPAEVAEALAQRLNRIISDLVEADAIVEPREFDLWRGMSAGSQAQGSWGNTKGDRAEAVVKSLLQRRIKEIGLVMSANNDGSHIQLRDGRRLVLADEPDFAIYRGDRIEAAVEIKGGIDTAGVLERIGAAIKSLSRARRDDPGSTTILIIQGVSLTQRALDDLEGNRDSVNHCFKVEDLLDDDRVRSRLWALLGL
jgi:hypothetical protein